ncbi:hypothetical protein GIX45_06725 [Erwinia sp. CPCC 100877]|nr:hypothetical protein [Erwinia sp. CPCC 100877]
MVDIKTIDYLRKQKDQSIDQLGKSLNVNWCTAKKYADDETLFTEEPIRKNKSMMDYACFLAIVESIPVNTK